MTAGGDFEVAWPESFGHGLHGHDEQLEAGRAKPGEVPRQVLR